MSKQTSVTILGVRVDILTMDQATKNIIGWIKGGSVRPRTVVKPYVEFMVPIGGQVDAQAKSALTSADMSVADGVSLQWGASFLYGAPRTKPTFFKLVWSALVWIQRSTWRRQILPERFAGIDFTTRVFDSALDHGWNVGVIGGSPDTARTQLALQERWPGLQLANVWSGYTRTTSTMDYDNANSDPEFMTILDEIRQQHLDVLFVAMGFPRQEIFMEKYKDSLGVKVLIGEGGSFDYKELGGTVTRSPRIIRSLHLEWLWRLFRQPSRIGRQLAVPRYTWGVFREARRVWLREKS